MVDLASFLKKGDDQLTSVLLANTVNTPLTRESF